MTSSFEPPTTHAPTAGIDPELLERVLYEQVGRHATEEIFAALDSPRLRVHPRPAPNGTLRVPVRAQPRPAQMSWEAGGVDGEVVLGDEQTVTLLLNGETLLGVDAGAGTVLVWPDGETAHIVATFGDPLDG